MAISGGTRLGSYEFVDSLGVGGMGEVYRAKDLKLKREVAIKVLPESLAMDAERLARFQREAEILASLNHPNIAQIFGLETGVRVADSDTDFPESAKSVSESAKSVSESATLTPVTALIMELIDGPTLAERLQQGPLPPDEALTIALQLAEALEAAHQRGIVHRDLKPANIKLRANGTVKVLDFGIAKAFDTNTGSHSGPQSPVLTTPAMTMSGMILGTAAYMSPEQARGKLVDQRTDIWAFGCVLYEMLTGQPAFGGEDVQETLARVITNTTDMKALPVAATPAVRQALELCLEKDPNKRIADIRDVKLVLKGRLGIHAAASVGAAGNGNKWRWLAAGVAATLIAALAAWWLKPAPEQAPAHVVRFDFALNEGQNLRNIGRDVLAISPDGTQIVYNTNAGLFVRAIGEAEGRLIPGTQQELSNPFFSPDGDWIGFWDQTTAQLKKIPAAGGSAVVLAPATNPFGASWHPDGSKIIFGQSAGLVEVSANGGQPSLLIPVTDGTLWDPQYLPNGALLFTAALGIPEIRIQRPGSGEVLVSFPGERAVYTPTGHLLVTDPFAAPTALFARTFDLATLALGGPVPVAANAAYDGAKTHFALATGGTLVSIYGVPGVNTNAGTQPDVYLTRVTRDGMQQRLNAPARPYRSPRLSPDGTQVAVEIINAGSTDSSIWVYDLAGDTDIRRLTQVSEGNNLRPVWTLDSRQLAFMSDRDGPGSIYLQSADGRGTAERLTTAEEGTFHIPESWAPDGSLSFGLIVGNFGASSWGVHTRNPAGEVAVFHDLETGNQFASAFSPDGNWLAYASGENSTTAQEFRIYVERYPKTGERYEVAVEGATYPVWSHDGTELFYRRGLGTQARTLNSVTILETEPRFRFSTTNSVDIGGFLNQPNYRDFDPFPDGSGWIMLTAMVDQTTAPNAAAPAAATQRINVVLNWLQELRQRVPTE